SLTLSSRPLIADWFILLTICAHDYEYNDPDWCEAGDQERTIKVFQSCAFCFIFIMGITGNCLVIATFSLYRRFRLRSMTDVFLFHLALADLLLLLTLPLQAMDTHLNWIFTSPLCTATRACYAINTYSGLMLLACISVDRYLVVVKAQEMLRLRSQILTGGMIAAVCVWFIAVLLSIPEIRYSGVSITNGEPFCVMKISGTAKKATNGAIIAIFCISFLVMVTCYSSIAKVLWEGRTFKRGNQWHRQRTLKLMVCLVFVFVLFQLPYTVVLLHKMAGSFCGLLLEYITCTLAYVRCCLNPILYALVGVRFRNDVIKLMRDRGCPCGPKLMAHTISSTSGSPPLAISSPCSPTSPERSITSAYNESTKFKFPGSSVL
uniref:Chemokine (C-C motif) receptor 10 n=1 Tax=Neogobius melanostomus TaxID=47308 RepID=A0A8C6WI43_9GOBI